MRKLGPGPRRWIACPGHRMPRPLGDLRVVDDPLGRGSLPTGEHRELNGGDIVADGLGPARVEPLMQEGELALHDQLDNLLVTRPPSRP